MHLILRDDTEFFFNPTSYSPSTGPADITPVRLINGGTYFRDTGFSYAGKEITVSFRPGSAVSKKLSDSVGNRAYLSEFVRYLDVAIKSFTPNSDGSVDLVLMVIDSVGNINDFIFPPAPVIVSPYSSRVSSDYWDGSFTYSIPWDGSKWANSFSGGAWRQIALYELSDYLAGWRGGSMKVFFDFPGSTTVTMRIQIKHSLSVILADQIVSSGDIINIDFSDDINLNWITLLFTGVDEEFYITDIQLINAPPPI